MRFPASRATSPLRPAVDATIIDTSELTLDQVLASLIELVKESSR